MEFISEFLKSVNGGENVIYRGHADCDWELKPSIGRHYVGAWSNVIDFEINALEEFKKRAIPHLKVTPKSDIEWLCLMQHHGCSTRLLDFTKNPLIALFFASDPSVDKHGQVIIAKYGRTYENVNDERLFERANSFSYYPPHITDRIVNQSGCFVYADKPNIALTSKQITGIRITNGNKGEIRDELKGVGISYSSLFPGLDGICQDLNDSLVWDLMLKDLFD